MYIGWGFLGTNLFPFSYILGNKKIPDPFPQKKGKNNVTKIKKYGLTRDHKI